MSRRLTPSTFAARRRAREMEKLARDICWAEFTIRPEMTRAAYWRRLPPETRERYIRDANWLVFIAKKLKPLRILGLVDA